MAITKTYDLLNINGVKGWIRDSWARRAIASLQQAVAAIVVPTKTSDLTNDSGYITSSDLPSVPSPSTASPKMDGTASAGSSSAWSRGDHVHPHDTSKADKATTLAGYGITNAYTKAEVDVMIPTVPTNVSAFTNDAGYITSAPVASVNGQTGTVTLSASDVGAQDVLTTAQLEAVNSGITAAKVSEYDGIVTMFGVPEPIPSGADLNNYMTPGHFSANSGNIASSLVNSPTSVNFTLFVIYRTTAIVSQIIIGSSSSIFIRHRTTTSWGSWYKLTGTTV